MEENFADDQMFSRRPVAGGEAEQLSFQIGETQMEQFNGDNGHGMLETSGTAVVDSTNQNTNTSDPTPANPNEERPPRMSKGAQKRFKALLAKGIPEDEARKQALIIPPPQVAKKKLPVVPPKRLDTNSRGDFHRRTDGMPRNNVNFVRPTGVRSSNSAPVFQSDLRTTNYQNPRQRPVYGNHPIVFRRHFHETATKQDPKQIRVGILPINYPIDLLTNEKMKLIEDQILKKIIEQKHSPMKPGFVNCVHKIGYILIICRDQMTVQWLMNIYNWSIENLQVVDSSNTPMTNVFEASFPLSAEMSTAAVFDLIEGQNHGVFTSKWKVISEVVAASALHLLIAMDHDSINTLEREKFKLYYRFTIVKLDHCFGSERDLILSQKKFSQPNNGVAQHQGRESYGSSMPVDNSRESVYSSDIYYNRY